MKNVYLIQFGAEFGDRNNQSVFFPYAIGCLAAYAWSKPGIGETYELKDLIFRRGDFHAAMLESPYLVCFSCYVWNYDYNILAAKAIKQSYPDCLIMFGGRQITYEASLLESLSFVDFLVCYEGELPFYRLLKELNGGALENVPSLIFRKNGSIVCNPVGSIDAEELVSPYLSGVFDRLLKRDTEYVATIETVRGCPFACAYCDTALPDRTVKLIPAERTKREIDWLSAHGVKMCFCIDSNFGMHPRDVEIARYLTEKKRAVGFPQKLDVALSKEKNASALQTVELLHNADMFNIVTLSVQSTNPETLVAVGRKNIDFRSFRESIVRYADIGIKPFTELILGLPCETYNSFCSGFEKLIHAGQKYYIEVYRCYILPNTALSRPEMISRYGIETVRTVPVLHHIAVENMTGISKSAEIVVATAAMSREEWVRANLFAILMQSCYFMGALNFVADYLYRENDVGYRVFFEGLMLYLLGSDRPTGAVLRRFESLFKNFAAGEAPLYYYDPVFGDLTWFAEEGLFLEIAKAPGQFYADIKPYLLRFVSSDFADELLWYQQLMLYVPHKEADSIKIHYDFATYFSSQDAPLQERSLRFTVRQNAQYESLADYAREVVWYRRKYGGTVCSVENSTITAE